MKTMSADGSMLYQADSSADRAHAEVSAQ